MNYPRIYLSIDNCFASKRWTAPADWAAVVRDLGLSFVEASADTEADPLYLGSGYMADWAAAVNAARKATGVRAATVYSGHGTYATLGLAHTDPRVRERFLESWLKPMVDTCASIGAGLGFFCHAFPVAVLDDPAAYAAATDRLYDSLAAVARYAKEKGLPQAGVEQMYSPNQVPWTPDGAETLLAEVWKRSRSPFYLTVDVGHQTGQRRFLRPEEGRVLEAIRLARAGTAPAGLWLGSSSANALFEAAVARPRDADGESVAAICADMDAHPYLFSRYGDGDTSSWLERLGRYSPIVHLQQVVGSSSQHLPFTPELNARGSVRGGEVLNALAASCRRPENPALPPPVPEIYLNLEIFSGTVELPRDILAKLRASVAYWRRFIPEDGLPLDELVARLPVAQ